MPAGFRQRVFSAASATLLMTNDSSILADFFTSSLRYILGDPAADSGGEGKSKWVEKYGMKTSKERPEDPLGTMSYQTSFKRSLLFCLLIGQKNTNVFRHQLETRTTATVWNWSVKTVSPGGLLAVLYLSSCHVFPPI